MRAIVRRSEALRRLMELTDSDEPGGPQEAAHELSEAIADD